MIRRGGSDAPVRIRRVASRPSGSGIRMSTSTTSGRVRRTAGTRPRIAPDGFAALGALPAVGWAARTRSAVALRTE
jgi:hypothetical protein